MADFDLDFASYRDEIALFFKGEGDNDKRVR